MVKNTLIQIYSFHCYAMVSFYGMASRYKKCNIAFMNLGLVDDSFHLPISLSPEDEKIYSIRNIKLYCKLIFPVPSNAKKALEVGSGFGGGSYIVSRYFTIPEVIGVDVLKSSVKYASNRFYNIDGLKFLHYSASNFINLSKKFDLIICLEASLHFENKLLFFQNVANSLSDDGTFCYADIFPNSTIIILESMLSSAGLVIIEKEDISEGVILSINTLNKQNGLSRLIELLMLNIHGANFTQGTILYRKLQNRSLRYIRYKLKKVKQ
ncbi:MAG: class I SAM-dependent methyltransferase [Chitinophagales bacterium]